MKKKKHKVKESWKDWRKRLRRWRRQRPILDYEGRDEVMAELRRALLVEPTTIQRTGNLFETCESTSGGIRTLQWRLGKYAVVVTVLTVDWDRTGKWGNPDPYRWKVDAVGWYNDLRFSYKWKTRTVGKRTERVITKARIEGVYTF